MKPYKTPRAITVDQRNKILKLFTEKINDKKIADLLNIDIHIINYYRHRENVIARTNKEYHKNYALKRRSYIRSIVFEHYSKGTIKCNCCGESTTEFLTIDHINGGGHQHRKNVGWDIYVWLFKNNFPEGFQVLCANCNQAKGHYKICPHKNTKENN